MHYTGQVYRHPMEAKSHLLEVTVGCSHNKCKFCTMYRDTPFKTSPLDHIKEDIKELRSLGYPIKRIFLVNGEAIVLSSKRLIEIGELIQQYLPEIETITSYASIKNILCKSVEDLKRLRELKFNEFHIGLETAYDNALTQMNKGFTKQEAYTAIEKLHKAGIDWDAHVMLGVAGKGNSEKHINETVKLINTFQPYMVSVMPTGVTTGSELETMVLNGEFIECTELEKLEEEKQLLRLLEFDDAYFFGSHYYNLVPISGMLTQKEEIIKRLDARIEELDSSILNTAKTRKHI